ncbi:methionine aminopeptidase 1D, mitochondrial-like isoform X2 [Daphnia carinata]|uniref:methionine aminopeptidase 1D, mitochondrial-like isoform X2 n=1 Tax=Daphnia carinata TaxID=120202 RepID=UPI00257F3A80|nr:methionine aminopeptidase 1D, mitochondrial-like isoform X2 [Daphnia carinata]
MLFIQVYISALSYRGSPLAAKSLLQIKRSIRMNSWFKKRLDFGNYQVIETPGQVLQTLRCVPSKIMKPLYAQDGQRIPIPVAESTKPEIKSHTQIDGMRASCRLARNALIYAEELVMVGTTTEEIDKNVHEYIILHGAYPSPLHYKGFPKSICTSVNNVVCHGIPDNRALVNGDIINVDITVYLNGFHGDVSETFLVGDVDEKGRELVAVTKKCLDEAVAICKPGRPFNYIGAVIEACARKHGFRVVPAFTGHGIGSYFHGAPDIYHFKNTVPGLMEAGQTFTIEPAVAQGSSQCIILEDKWTAITSDGSRAAQFEHTVLITESGVEVLTSK